MWKPLFQFISRPENSCVVAVPPRASYDYLEAWNDYVWEVAEAMGASCDVRLWETCEGLELVVTVDKEHLRWMKPVVEVVAHNVAVYKLQKQAAAQSGPGNQNG